MSLNFVSSKNTALLNRIHKNRCNRETLINFAKMMVNRLNQENQGNRQEDQKPSFVPFTILNGVLAALVLASIFVGIFLAVEMPWRRYYPSLIVFLFLIGIIGLDLSAVIIGFIAVANKNASGMVLFLSVSAWILVVQAPFVLITDIVWIVMLIQYSDSIPTKNEILGWSLVVLSTVRIVTFIIMFFKGNLEKYNSSLLFSKITFVLRRPEPL